MYLTRLKTLDTRWTHPQGGQGNYDSSGHTAYLIRSGHEPWWVRRLDAWLTHLQRGYDLDSCFIGLIFLDLVLFLN